ncbi:uncharacterized protein M6B38_404880 [Iris pallida]|uniref:Uncharacterized protein n=1 Tax=Iris pallida TaxID=29817 RepID=A0AAX6FRI7_IRIPA|nr:uncharacterized protein M6B38_404880 [Iris pallida]
MTGMASATKMKRKDFEEAYDEFSEFSLNSPARKIRRLDADLPPIMEEGEPSFSATFGQNPPLTEGQMNGSSMSGIESVMVEDEPSFPSNEETALVLYKPVENPLVLSPNSFRVRLDLIDGLKNQVFWSGSSKPVTIEEVPMDYVANASGNSLALVPWVQSQDLSGSRGVIVEEPMDADGQGGASMEIEEDGQQGEGLNEWPQHCLTTQIPGNNSTPVMWSWG